MRYISVLLLLGLFWSGSALRAQQLFQGGPEQATLLELYTSEGCSSCPPADRWLGELLDDPGLWRTVIPVAFHVDYWDYLGWQDRFARSSYAVRQRDYHRQGSTSAVYTPGVMIAGQEWRSWRRAGGVVPLSGARTGRLTLELDAGAFVARYRAEPAGLQAERLHVAILGFALKTPVKRGENRGRSLEHNFVVLGHRSYSSDASSWRGELPPVERADEADRLALAAWVSPAKVLQPLQAVGGWLETTFHDRVLDGR